MKHSCCVLAHRFITSLVIFAACCLAPASRAQIELPCYLNDYLSFLQDSDDTTLSQLRAVGSNGQLLCVSDSYNGVRFANVADSSNPYWYPKSLILGTRPRAIPRDYLFTDDDHVFIASPNYGLITADVSDPTQPVIANVVETLGQPWALAADGDTLFLSDRLTGLMVFDASDPAQPVHLATFPTQDLGVDIAFRDQLVYILLQSGGLLIVDVTEPDSPVQIGALEFSYPNCESITLTDDHAISISTNGSAHAIDITDPEAPTLTNNFLLQRRTVRLEAVGNLVYSASDSGDLVAYDLSDPLNPVLGAQYHVPGDAVNFAIHADKAYVSSTEGIQILSQASPKTPHIGIGDMFGSPREVVVEGNYGYVASGPYGLTVFDISSLEEPSRIYNQSSGASATDIVVDKNIAYLARSDWGIYSIDVSDPFLPVTLDTHPVNARSVDKVGDLIFAGHTAGVDILDVTDPGDMTVLGTIPSDGFVEKIQISGNLVYLMNRPGGITVYDYSDPSSPELAGSYSPGPYPTDITIYDGLAYISYGALGLHIVDLANPANPIVIAVLEAEVFFENCEVGANTAFIYEHDFGIHIVDVTDPSQPAIIGIFGTEEFCDGSLFLDNYLYTLQGDEGLVILDVDPVCDSIPCLADTNNDGNLSPADFTAWINAFNNDLPECDQNADGACTPADFTAWIANYNAGCS